MENNLPQLPSRLTLPGKEYLKTLTPEQLGILYERLRLYSKILKRSLATEDIFQFAREVMNLKTPPYWLDWFKLIKSHRRLLVEAARDHGKTFFFSYAYPIWSVQRIRRREEAQRIIMLSYSSGQAETNLDRIRREIESNSWIRWLYPKDMKGMSFTWDKTRLDFANGCSIEAMGFFSAIRGRHPNLFLIDDPCKDEGAGTISLDQQIKYFQSVIIPSAGKRGQIVVTGNPVDQHDFLEWLEKNAKFQKAYYPAYDNKCSPLWPEQYSYQDILDIRETMAWDLFQREYLLRRVAAGDGDFKQSWFIYYTPDDLAVKHENGSLSWLPLYKVMTIDPALPGGDAAAAVITGTDTRERTFILDKLATREDIDFALDSFCDMMIKHDPDIVGVEEFAFQKMYKSALEKKMGERGILYKLTTTGRDTQKSKAMRIKALQPKVKTGRLLFRKDEDVDMTDELLSWDPRSKHNKDDLIDALAWQVPLWRSPYETDSTPSHPGVGTYDDAVQELMEQDPNFLKTLFSDFAAHG